jgi:hypothetical protein
MMSAEFRQQLLSDLTIACCALNPLVTQTVLSATSRRLAKVALGAVERAEESVRECQQLPGPSDLLGGPHARGEPG